MLAWRIAQLPRVKRPDVTAKKWLILTPDQRRKPRQTWQQMKSATAMWMAALGGKIIKKED